MESKKTPFYEKHVLAHAKIVDFAGYKMPMFYKGIVPEHLKVRKSVGVFDINHMGEFMIKVADAGAFIDRMITNNVANLQPHKIKYSAMCYENGTIVDDLLVYKLSQDEWMLVVNASNLKKDWDWLLLHKEGNFEMTDVSAETALLAVQGPKSEAVLQPLTKFDLSTLPYYTSAKIEFNGIRLLLSAPAIPAKTALSYTTNMRTQRQSGTWL
jgi:aminomethyltransferase